MGAASACRLNAGLCALGGIVDRWGVSKHVRGNMGGVLGLNGEAWSIHPAFQPKALKALTGHGEALNGGNMGDASPGLDRTFPPAGRQQLYLV